MRDPYFHRISKNPINIRTHIWCKPKRERPGKVQLCPQWKGWNSIPSW